jgi:hypothetical protein
MAFRGSFPNDSESFVGVGMKDVGTPGVESYCVPRLTLLYSDIYSSVATSGVGLPASYVASRGSLASKSTNYPFPRHQLKPQIINAMSLTSSNKLFAPLVVTTECTSVSMATVVIQ